jgi:hypothetical protein
MRAAVYGRVSTTGKSKQGDTLPFVQNPEVQEQPLRDLVSQRGWNLHRVYSDRASGAAERRPGLDTLMADARRGLFKVVIVWRFDRFARSVKQLVLGLEEFRALGIDFVSHQEALDSSTPLGKAMFTIIGAMANWNAISSGSASSPGWNTPAETGPNPGSRWVGPKPSLIVMRSSDFAMTSVCRGDRLLASCEWAVRQYGGRTKSGWLHKRLSMSMWNSQPSSRTRALLRSALPSPGPLTR